MSDKEMPKEVSIMGGCPLSALPGPATYLAQGEDMLKTLEARKAHKAGKGVAGGKKGRLRAALRHLWSHFRQFQADSERLDFSRASFRPHRPGPLYYPREAWTAKRRFESVDPVRQLPPEEEKG